MKEGLVVALTQYCASIQFYRHGQSSLFILLFLQKSALC